MEEQLNEATVKVSEYESAVASLVAAQAKAVTENTSLSSQLADAESKLGSLSKAKAAQDAQVEDLSSELQTETSVSVQQCDTVYQARVLFLYLHFLIHTPSLPSFSYSYLDLTIASSLCSQYHPPQLTHTNTHHHSFTIPSPSPSH